MSTNITGLAADRPLVDPAIAVDEDFLLGGHLLTAGGGGWNESAEIYFEWDQGTATWTSLSSTGALNIAAQGNPTAVLQDINEHQVTVYSDGTAGSFQVRLKAIEDDATEYTTTPVDVTVTGVEDIAIGTGGTLYEEVGVDAELGVTVSLPDPLIISVYDEVTVEEDVTGDVVTPSTAFEIDVSETILVIEGYRNIQVAEAVYGTYSSRYCEYLQMMRTKLAAAGLPDNGNRIRFRITASDGYATRVSRLTVGQSDGETHDIEAGTITNITFNGGSLSVEVPSNESVWSDWVKYKPFDGGSIVITSWTLGDGSICCPYFTGDNIDTYWGGDYSVSYDITQKEALEAGDYTKMYWHTTSYIFNIDSIQIGNGTKIITFHPDYVFIDEQDALDYVLLDEDVSVSVLAPTNLYLSVYDEVSIEESVSLALELVVNVYDEIGVDEDITVSLFEETLMLSVYDEVDAIEDITALFIEENLNASVYEEVDVVEDVVFAYTSDISIYDEVGVDEYWLEDITSFVLLYDEVSIDEDVLASLPDALVVDLNDEITVTEADYVPQLGAAGDCDVNLYDEVGIDELVVSSLPDDLTVSVNDSVAVVDKTPVYQLLYDTKVAVGVVTGISVYDEVTLTESITIEQLREINVYDEVAVTEDHEETVYLTGGTALEVDVYDSVGIAEDITFEFISYISVVDEVTVVESTELAFESIVSVYDSVAVTEDYSVTFDLTIDVYDEVTVADIVTISADIDISISDEVSITEDIERSEISYVFVYDDISLAEDVTSYKYTGIYTVSVYDSVSTLEDIDLLCYQGVYLVSVYDEVSTDENVTVSTALAGINIEDSVGVADVPVVELGTATLIISINDEINLGEDAQAGLSDLSPSVSDSIVVSEYLNVPAFYSLIVGSVLIIEDVVLILPEFNVTTKPTQMLTLFQNTEFKTGLIVPKMTTDVILPSIEVELL